MLALFGLAPACGGGGEATRPGLHVSAALVAEPVLGERAAMYLTIANRSGRNDELLSVSTELAGRAEIHRSVDRGGMVTMEPVATLNLPDGATVSLAPGGHHIMLLELGRDLRPGDIVPAALHFRHAAPIRIKARVVAYTDLEEALGAEEPGHRVNG